jgi:hypothetical protein
MTSDAPSSRADRIVADDLPPAWFALPLAAALVLLLAVSVVGVVSAILGVFTPAIVVSGTLVLGAPAAVMTVRAIPVWSSARSAHAAAALVACFVVAVTMWNGLNHGQHLVADRDPGVYVTTARHLMDEGDVLVPGPVGPFRHAPGVSPNGAGFSPIRDDGTLEPQFPHLTAVSLALGGWIAEVGIFLVTPALAGLGLLCLDAFASTVVGPRWAAVATTVTGVTMPFLVFARDAYSEPITTVSVFGGLWLLHVAHRSGRHPVWLLAGLTLGMANMARVDGYLYLAPVVLALVLAVRLAPPEQRRATSLGATWCGLGLVVTSAIGLWDTVTLTGGYFHAGLSDRLPAMLGVAVAAGLVAFFAAPHLWRPEPGTDSTEDLQPTRPLQQALGALAAAGVVFFAWGWWLRPDPEGLPVVATEGVNILSYLPQAATLSMRWLGWYLGPIPLTAALLGVLWSVVRLGRVPRPDPAVVAGLGAVLVPLLLYLWTPNITPDHPWAMRRFAAVALPGLAIGISASCHALWSVAWRKGDVASPGVGRLQRALVAARPRLGPALAVIVAATSIATAAAITWPVRDARAQIPLRQRMHEICDVLEPDDAVLVTIDGILAFMMSVPLGVWCDVPTAGGMSRLEVREVARLAVEWEAEGKRLVVLSSSETPLFNTLRPAGIVTQTIELDPMYPETIEPTLTSRPNEVVVDGRLGKGPDGEVTFYLYVIDTDRARRLLRSGH